MLYNYSANAIKAVSPVLRVGGPATCQVALVSEFVTYCQKNNVPYDFVSTHLYPTDPNLNISDKNSFADAVRAVSAQAYPVPLLLTEYNAGLGIHTLDKSYAAAFVYRQIALMNDIPNLCKS